MTKAETGGELMGATTRNALGAVLFMQAATLGMDVYSAVNSSPWTVENFGADEQKAKSVKEYVLHGVALTVLFSVGAAWVAQNPWPLIGAAVSLVYMYWLYMRALRRGKAAGSTDWQNASQPLPYGAGRFQ